jgi:hypothetical protein
LNIPKLENIELELKFTDAKVNQNQELLTLFNKTNINLEWFMLEFRKQLINQDFDWLIKLAYNNFEPKNQLWTFWGFDILSKLLKEININISWENLLSQAKNLWIKRDQDIRVSKLHAILDATNQKY